MDLLSQLMMQASGQSISNQVNSYNVEKCTNKQHLLEKHKQCLKKMEIDLGERRDKKNCILQTTTSTKFKSSSVNVHLRDENRIGLKDLLKAIDKPINGKFLLCRSICPPFKMTALFTVVDDPDGKLGACISLYNFVVDLSPRHPKDVYQYLPVGTILAIMNPWLKKTADGGLTIRCDNPADVVVLNQSTVDEIFGNLTWKERIPSEYNQKAILSDSSVDGIDWKRIGNEHFVSKRFKDATIAYTKGIDEEKHSTKLDLLANRSAAYLGLCKYNLALTDAESVLSIDPTHTKCIFRKTKALFGMVQYQDAMTFLGEVLIASLSKQKQKIISDLIIEAKSLIAQSQKGEYPWKKILKNDDNISCFNQDLAEFKGTVIVKDTPSKGRGLFASDDIKAGQLILASRAVSYVIDKSKDIFLNLNQDTKYLTDRSQTQLVMNVAQILNENPERCQEVYNLYAGRDFSNYKAGRPDDLRVDMNRIQAICHYNAFGQVGFGSSEKNDSGLWLTPSFINHSCVDANCFWTRKGDFLFVHASNDIARDQEILISYFPPFGSMPQEKLKKYEFICDCRLCIRDRYDDSTIQAKRTALISRLDTILGKYTEETMFPNYDFENDDVEIRNIIKSLEDLRRDSPELNVCYMDKLQSLAAVYCKVGLFLESAATLKKAYKIITNIPALYDNSLLLCSNIIGSYLMADKIDEAKTWIRVLKRKASLAYGTWDVIEVMFPFTFKLIEEFGLSITDI